MPGDNLSVKVKLSYPLSVKKGLQFAIREGGKTIAAGVIGDVLPNDDADKTLGFAKVKKVN